MKGLVRSIFRGPLPNRMVFNERSSVQVADDLQIEILDSGQRAASVVIGHFEDNGALLLGGVPHMEMTRISGGTVAPLWEAFYSLGTIPTTNKELEGQKSNFGGPVHTIDGVQPDIGPPTLDYGEWRTPDLAAPVLVYFNMYIVNNGDITGDTTFRVTGDYVGLFTSTRATGG